MCADAIACAHYQGDDVHPLPLRTAAEHGVRDSRYTEVPDDIRDLDPGGRSLMREGRRAALEGSQQAPGTPAQQEDQGTGEFAAPQGYDPGQRYDRAQGYDDRG